MWRRRRVAFCVGKNGTSVKHFSLGENQRLLAGLSVAVWLVSFVVVIGLLIGGYLHRDVPYQVYTGAGRHWLAHAPLYNINSIDGFQYLPQTAILFSLFSWMGSPAGDVSWRLVGWAVYALGIWRIAHQLEPMRWAKIFLMTTGLAIAPAVGSLANGQANILIAGLMMYAASDLNQRHWWRATTVLTIGLAVKPLMVVMLLLVWALYPQMMWRLPVALGVLFAAPWAVGAPSYVMTQYRDCLIKLQISSRPDRFFEDARGLMSRLGWVMAYSTYFVTRLLAAVGTAGMCLWMRVRRVGPHESVYIAAFAAAYLMLFNPRTQSNSYSIVAPIAALLAATYLQGHGRVALAMFLVLLSWYGNSHWMRFSEFWLKPLGAVAFWVLLIWEIVGSKAAIDPDKTQNSHSGLGHMSTMAGAGRLYKRRDKNRKPSAHSRSI